MKNNAKTKEVTKSNKTAKSKEATPLDLSKIPPIEPVKVTRGGRSSVAVSIVNTLKHGKRFTLSNGLMERLKNPKYIEVRAIQNKIIITKSKESNEHALKVSKNNVYNAGLVLALTEEFDLDFSKCTSISFSKIIIKKAQKNGREIDSAVVRIKSKDKLSQNEN